MSNVEIRPYRADSHGMESVFLLNGRYAAQVRLWFHFGEESFKSRGSDIGEHADRLIRMILETVDRAAGGVNAIPGDEVGPGIVHEKANPAFDDIKPFVFVVMVM
jgi:hypothetical protein